MKAKVRFSWGQGLIALVLVIILVLGGTTTARAAEIITGETIPAGQTINDDALIGGNTVIVDGTVNGNLVAGGETITLNGIVNGDAILMGRTVIVSQSAQINGNLFIGSQVVEVSGKISGSMFTGAAAVEMRSGAEVTGNVYVGAYSFESAAQTNIGRDLLFGGYQARLGGELARNLKAAGAAFDLNGLIGGDANINLGNALETTNQMPMWWNYMGENMPEPAQPGLRIGPDAVIKGKLSYTSTVPVEFSSQPAGGVVYSTPVPEQVPQNYRQPEETRTPAANWGFGLLRSLATLLILGALTMWLAPRLLKRSAGLFETRTLPSLGIGFLAVVLSVPVVLLAIGVVIALMLLFGLLSLGGLAGLIGWVGFLAISAAICLFTLLAVYVGKLALAYLVGKLLFEKLFKAEGVSPWIEFGIGILLVTLLIAIPIIGWLFGLFIILIGLGTVWYLLRREPAAAVPAVEPPAL